MEQSLSKQTLDHPQWSPAAQNIFYTLLQSEVDWSICCNWAFARWTSDSFTLDHRPPQPTPEFCRATWRLSASQAAHFSIWYRSLPSSLFHKTIPRSLLMHLSSCEWFGFQGRTWAVGGGCTAGESGVWAGWRAGLGTHQGQIDRARLEGRRSERDGRRRRGRPWAERPAQQTNTPSGNRHLSQRDLYLNTVIWVDWETSKFAFLKNYNFSCL